MDNATPLSNTVYDISKVMGNDAEFLYETIDKYIDDAEKANKKRTGQCLEKNKLG